MRLARRASWAASLLAGWLCITVAGIDAQNPASGAAPPSPGTLLEDLMAANRILAPELVTADDLMELDLDSTPIDPRGRNSYQERFIHGEIYKARPDVMAVVHMHAPTVIPFGSSNVALRPMFHMSAFIAEGVPVFDIRDTAGMTDMLVSNAMLGAALARALSSHPAALMRGHGAVVVGPSLPITVGRSVYLKTNAEMQAQAIALGGTVKYLDPEEARKAGTPDGYQRAWTLWRRKALGR